jgi:hypothetical protein
MSALLHVLLGANGDLCAMLPYFKAEAERTGAPVPVLVAEQYAPLFEGVSYAVPVSCPAGFQDLMQAMKWLRAEMPDVPVKVIQYHGRHHETGMPSFLDEMWYQAGAWKDWEKQPLVFDKRDAEREDALALKILGNPWISAKRDHKSPFGVISFKSVEARKPTILVGTKGRSSPFLHAAQLIKRLRSEFGKTHQIVNLDRVKAHRVYDLLGLYDRAAALVSIDTVHLHLSRASSVPVFALARDYPTRWHGTPHQERFAFHCRYGDYPKRADEMMVALRETLDGKAAKIELKRCAPKGDYNPAIIEGEPVVARNPYAGDWRTRLRFANLLQTELHLPKAWGKHSHEDLRYFKHNGETWGSLTLSTAKNRRMPKCATGYGRMKLNEIPKLLIPKYGQNDFSGMEKNWVFFSHGGKVHAIYSCHFDHIVLELDGEKVTQEYHTPGPTWEYGEIRGGTPPVPYQDGTWLRFFHSRIWDRKRPRKPRNKTERIFQPQDRIPWRYYVGALVMESEPPFRVLDVSSSPILTGTEQWVPGCPHWKPNVVIPYGCVPQADGWTVSLGVNDALACLATIKPEQLKLSRS